MSTSLLVITGPTACGKTARAVQCARAFNGEIVSADSRQIYRSMDLGTGKDLDEAYGLIETIEKAAEIYMLIADKKVLQSISNDNLKEIAKAFHIEYRKGIID